MGVGEAVDEAVGAGLLEGFVGAPASGGVALLEDEGEAVAGGGEMFLAAVGEVALHGGAEGVDVAVGVRAGEHVDVFGERIEVGVVFEEALGELAIAWACAALVGEVEVFGEGVGLVPGPGDVFVGAGGHLFAVEGFGRAGRGGRRRWRG